MIDPISGERTRSARRSENYYEHKRPGDMIHVDVKNLGRIPAGSGWRMHERSEAVHGRGNGCAYIHTAIDDRARLFYSGIHHDEKDSTCAGFLHRALAWSAARGVIDCRLLTNNAMVLHRGGDWG